MKRMKFKAVIAAGLLALAVFVIGCPPPPPPPLPPAPPGPCDVSQGEPR